jgi:hypothetical protein
MSGRIIGFSGRCRSGKSTLADICEKYGYKRLYFALPLKTICAEFLNISIDELNRLKNENIGIDIDISNDAIEYFSEQTKIPIETVQMVIGGKHIKNVREMLQVIGTDLIRGYNMNWHINKIREMINPDKKYVIEDVRFPNEKEMIEELGGENWFVVRPQLSNISHHISEESLKWQDFGDNVIINNKSLEYLSVTWENFLLNYDMSVKLRQKLVVDISLKGLGCIKDDAFTLSDSLFISPYFFNYKKNNINEEQIRNVSLNDKGNAVVELKDGSILLISNPLNIEDLKFLVN